MKQHMTASGSLDALADVKGIANKKSAFSTALVTALGAALAGCATTLPASSMSTPASSPSATPVDEVHVVIIGDSLAATGWPEEFGRKVSSKIGRPVTVDVLEELGVADAAAAVPSSPLVAAADIVVVQTGYNNVLPDPETGIGCGGSLDKGVTPWIKSTEPTCLAEGVRTYGGLYEEVFQGAKKARRDEPTVFVAMTSVCGNLDTGADSLLGQTAKPDRKAVAGWVVASCKRWNTMLTDKAKAANFQVVDAFHALNGPEGSSPVGDTSDDGRHPNAKGDALYVRLLESIDLSVLTGK